MQREWSVRAIVLVLYDEAFCDGGAVLYSYSINGINRIVTRSPIGVQHCTAKLLLAM